LRNNDLANHPGSRRGDATFAAAIVFGDEDYYMDAGGALTYSPELSH
jgi:hypothetical protein